MKHCEKCGKDIPEEYVNLLCSDCYQAVSDENEHQKEMEHDNSFDQPQVLVAPVVKEQPSETRELGSLHRHPHEDIIQRARSESRGRPEPQVKPITGKPSQYGITDTQYQENPEMEELNMVQRTVDMYNRTKLALWYDRVAIYNTIKNYCFEIVKTHPQFPKFIWKPKVCDVGCGIGTGSNILSQEADFVWGIDKSSDNICWATQCYSRNKNNIYYVPQISFDVVDVTEEYREIMTFDVIAAIELIEHIYETDKVLSFLKRLCKKNKQGQYITQSYGEQQGPYETVVFITSPNRNAPEIHKDKPFNPNHVREWTVEEMVNLLGGYFGKVETLDWYGDAVPANTQLSPVLYRCTKPLQ